VHFTGKCMLYSLRQLFADSANLVSERLKSYPRVSEISLSCTFAGVRLYISPLCVWFCFVFFVCGRGTILTLLSLLSYYMYILELFRQCGICHFISSLCCLIIIPVFPMARFWSKIKNKICLYIYTRKKVKHP
jgi:hypothetical protein